MREIAERELDRCRPGPLGSSEIDYPSGAGFEHLAEPSSFRDKARCMCDDEAIRENWAARAGLPRCDAQRARKDRNRRGCHPVVT